MFSRRSTYSLAGQLQHQRFVEAEDGLEVEAVEAFDGGKARRPDAPLDHAALAVDQLQLGQAQEVARVAHVLRGTETGNLLMLAQEGRQLELLEMMGEQDLWGSRSWPRPGKQAHVGLGRSGLDMGLGQGGIDIQIETRRPSLDPAQQQVLDRIETDRPQSQGLAHGGLDLAEREALQETQGPWTYARLPAAP